MAGMATVPGAGPAGLAFGLTAALGVPLGARESIPWSVVTAASKGSGTTGANTSVFNLSQVPARSVLPPN